MKGEKIDAVKMTRDIQNLLSKRYNKNPEEEKRDLSAIRRKYGLKKEAAARKEVLVRQPMVDMFEPVYGIIPTLVTFPGFG